MWSRVAKLRSNTQEMSKGELALRVRLSVWTGGQETARKPAHPPSWLRRFQPKAAGAQDRMAVLPLVPVHLPTARPPPSGVPAVLLTLAPKGKPPHCFPEVTELGKGCHHQCLLHMRRRGTHLVPLEWLPSQ